MGSKNMISKNFTVSLTENEVGRISCSINQKDSQVLYADWILNESQILNSDKIVEKYNFDNQNANLIIKNVHKSDSGLYECFAETEENNYHTRVDVVVNPSNLVPARLISKIKQLKAEKDKSVLLDCAWWFTNSENFLFDSSIVQIVEWKLNETLIDENAQSNKYEFLDSFNTLLKINNLQPDETYNTYTCNFKSTGSDIKQSVFLLNIGGLNLFFTLYGVQNLNKRILISILKM